MMAEPQRMLDQTTSPIERALLLEARAYRAPDGLRTRTLSALGLSASAGLVASVGAWLSAKSWITKVLLAFSTMTIGVGLPLGYVLLTHRPPAAQATVPVAVVTRMPAQTVPIRPAPSTAPAPAQARAVGSPAPAAAARAPAVTSSTLLAEVAALDVVRTTLANDDAASALSLLATYSRTFPRGRLRYEAEALRIEALARAGQLDTAKRHAQQFLRRHPNSVLAARVRPYSER
jgi:hypothetical protein